jgi:hypothetical protein
MKTFKTMILAAASFSAIAAFGGGSAGGGIGGKVRVAQLQPIHWSENQPLVCGYEYEDLRTAIRMCAGTGVPLKIVGSNAWVCDCSSWIRNQTNDY